MSSSEPTPTTADPLAAVDAAVADGRFLDAVDALHAHNRRHRSPENDQRLVELRHRAFDELVAVRPAEPGPWPPAWSRQPLGSRQVPRADGLAAVVPGEVDADAVGRGIQSHGCLLLPGLVGPAKVAALRTGIDEAFAAREAADAAEGPKPTVGPYAPFRPAPPHRIGPKRIWAADTGGLLAFDAPGVLFDLLDTLDELGVLAAIHGYLGERPALSFNKCTLRRVDVDSGTDWHQDGAFLGEGIRTVNVWMALTDCGIDAPGLDVVPRRIDHLLPTGTDGSFFDWSIGDGAVQREAGADGVVRPSFRAGDVLLFDDRFVHRTAVHPEMTIARHAIESWFFAPSAYPDGRIPLAV